MASYQIEEFKDVFQRLRLPDQVGKIADMLTLIRRFPNEANGRPLSELVECIEQIDANPELTASLSGVRAHLVDRAVRGLLARDPDAPLRLAAMDRAAIMRTLPLLGFRPAISEDQIGPASVDLTLGVRDGESVGTTIEVRKGDLVVLPTLESHGEWPEGLLGRVSVRSGPARKGTECDTNAVKHLNSIWIFPGSRGPIQLELAYLGEEPARWILGETRLVQLTFFNILRTIESAVGEPGVCRHNGGLHLGRETFPERNGGG